MAIKEVQIKGYLYLFQFTFFLQTVNFLATHILARNPNNFYYCMLDYFIHLL